LLAATNPWQLSFYYSQQPPTFIIDNIISLLTLLLLLLLFLQHPPTHKIVISAFISSFNLPAFASLIDIGDVQKKRKKLRKINSKCSFVTILFWYLLVIVMLRMMASLFMLLFSSAFKRQQQQEQNEQKSAMLAIAICLCRRVTNGERERVSEWVRESPIKNSMRVAVEGFPFLLFSSLVSVAIRSSNNNNNSSSSPSSTPPKNEEEEVKQARKNEFYFG